MTDCPGVDCFHREIGIAELTEDHIRLLVDTFYEKVRSDAELGPIFAGAIAEDAWPEHLATMRKFWSSIMLTSGRYHGNPVAVHRRLNGVSPENFLRWLALFGETSGELFGPEVATAFKAKADRIARSLQMAMFYRPGDNQPRARRNRASSG